MNNAAKMGITFWRKPMPTTRQLVLSEEQRHQLTHLRDASPKPYLRERAAALLKIADGVPAAQVARRGLLRPRQPDTVYRWFNSFLAQGIEGLKVKPGAGRKPAFFPSTARPKSRSRRAALLGQTRPTSARARQREADIDDHKGNV